MDNTKNLRNMGLKATYPRLKILELFQSGEHRHLTAEDVYRLLDAAGVEIGLATVYRQLNGLAAKGRADTIRLNEQQMFRICDESGHHHHLVCEQCGRTVEIDPPDENWLRKVAQEHGYTVISHTVEVFGLCPDCQAIQAQE